MKQGLTTSNKMPKKKSNQRRKVATYSPDQWYDTAPTIGVNAKRQGGQSVRIGGHPRYTVEMTHKEVKYIQAVWDLTCLEDIKPNYMVTIHIKNSAEKLQKQKKQYQFKINDLVRKKLKGKGYNHIGISSFERHRKEDSTNPQLHVHHCFYCPPDAYPIIKKAIEKHTKKHDNCDIKITKTHDNSIGYLTKYRQSLKPEIDHSYCTRKTKRFFRRQPGDFVPGNRFAITVDLKKIVSCSKIERPPARPLLPKPINRSI